MRTPTMTLEDVRASNRVALTRTETAALFGVDPRTVTQGIKDGEIPSITIGKRVLVPRLRLLAMLTGDSSDVNETNY